MNFKLFEKKIYVNTHFVTKDIIVPIGSDCHSAHILNALKFRKFSLIFDWLYTDSRFGIQYVNDNIKTNFESFLENLTYNQRNHIISENYPFTEFFHEKELITSIDNQEKLKKRALRFLEIIKNKNVSFLYVINPEHFLDLKDVEKFIKTLVELNTLTSQKHKIKIFIKFKNNLKSNFVIDALIEQSNNIDNVTTVKYHLDTEKYGQWGNSKDYYRLFKNLNIDIQKSIMPKILLINSK